LKLTHPLCTSLLPPLCLRQEIAVDHERLAREEKEDEERQRTQNQQRSADTALRPLGGSCVNAAATISLWPLAHQPLPTHTSFLRVLRSSVCGAPLAVPLTQTRES
jgi:hypothetical protein